MPPMAGGGPENKAAASSFVGDLLGLGETCGGGGRGAKADGNGGRVPVVLRTLLGLVTSSVSTSALAVSLGFCSSFSGLDFERLL